MRNSGHTLLFHSALSVSRTKALLTRPSSVSRTYPLAAGKRYSLTMSVARSTRAVHESTAVPQSKPVSCILEQSVLCAVENISFGCESLSNRPRKNHRLLQKREGRSIASSKLGM